ncbi:MAG: hypothetical protein KDA85_20025, partial [Planctomycetaceae bacterium]|nr:hypothetical protein [Planctomycetaceae bacterium]
MLSPRSSPVIALLILIAINAGSALQADELRAVLVAAEDVSESSLQSIADEGMTTVVLKRTASDSQQQQAQEIAAAQLILEAG